MCYSIGKGKQAEEKETALSTRCVTIVRQRTYWDKDNPEIEELCRFYRHCDGYPEGHGRDIADAILESSDHAPYCESWSQNVLAKLFAKNACMELEGHDARHGDLEFIYVIEGSEHRYYGANEADEVLMHVYSGWDSSYDDFMSEKHPIFSGHADEYIEWLVGGYESWIEAIG